MFVKTKTPNESWECCLGVVCCNERVRGNAELCVCVLQVFGSRVRVDAVSKVAELELAEKEKMKEKVEKILQNNINVFINR